MGPVVLSLWCGNISWQGHSVEQMVYLLDGTQKRRRKKQSPAVSQQASQWLQLSQGLHLLQVSTAHNTEAFGVHSAGVQQPVLSAFWVWELLGRCLQELGLIWGRVLEEDRGSSCTHILSLVTWGTFCGALHAGLVWTQQREHGTSPTLLPCQNSIGFCRKLARKRTVVAAAQPRMQGTVKAKRCLIQCGSFSSENMGSVPTVKAPCVRHWTGLPWHKHFVKTCSDLTCEFWCSHALSQLHSEELVSVLSNFAIIIIIIILLGY